MTRKKITVFVPEDRHNEHGDFKRLCFDLSVPMSTRLLSFLLADVTLWRTSGTPIQVEQLHEIEEGQQALQFLRDLCANKEISQNDLTLISGDIGVPFCCLKKIRDCMTIENRHENRTSIS